MKKTVFVHLLNDYSGSPKVLSQILTAYQRNGDTAELYTGFSGDGFLSNLTNQHYLYFYKRFDNKYFTLFSFLLSQFILFLKLLKYCKQDVVIYVNTLLPFGAALAGKCMAKPVYYHIHEISLRPTILKKFLRFIVAITASKIVFVSQTVHDAEFFVGKQQSVVSNALPDDFMLVAEKHIYEWQIDGYFNVLMICSLKKYKGVLEFIDLAQHLRLQTNVRFTLVLNAEQAEIENFFTGIDIPSNLILVPRQTNLIDFYQKANLVLNLSRIDEWLETFGLTIIEAMAFGIPVIVPPVGGPTEIVTDGNEGFLISSYEIEKIAERISLLSKDKAQCLLLSEKAKLRAKYFSQENFDKKIIQVLRD